MVDCFGWGDPLNISRALASSEMVVVVTVSVVMMVVLESLTQAALQLSAAVSSLTLAHRD